jgi:hypothetical protein
MEDIKTYENLKNFLEISGNKEIIKTNLMEIILLIKGGNHSNQIFNKKYTENIFNFLLRYIFENLDFDDTKNFIEEFLTIILDLSFLHNDVLNENIKKFLEEKTSLIINNFSFNQEFEKYKKKETVSFLLAFINVGLFICYLTYKINKTNQFVSNYIMLAIIILNKSYFSNSNDKKNKDNYFIVIFKLKMLSLLLIISQNINCYNPDIINISRHLLNFIKNNELEDKENINNNDKNINKNLLSKSLSLKIGLSENLTNIESYINNNTNTEFSLLIFLKKIININYKIMQIYKNEINFNTIFNHNIIYLKEFKNYITNNISDKEINENYFYLIKESFDFYELFSKKCLLKKNVQINFLILKKKAIPSLEPEYDFGWIDEKIHRERINKAIEGKIKRTKKQAIRNLKKESRVLDQERQKVYKKIQNKRKEDQKLANQFTEETNLEAKKLATSNAKKRYKLTKGKITKK